jgi:casein kinase 1
VTPTPHREHRRDREHGGRRRQAPDGTTPNQLVLSPSPAHVKSRRPQTGEQQRGSGLGSGNGLGSVQPLAPTSRRASQRDQRELNGHRELYSHTPPHPYATNYKSNAYGRHSPNAPNAMPHLVDMNVGSESYLQGQTHAGKNRTAETNGFDMQRGDEDGGHGRKGFSRMFFCC